MIDLFPHNQTAYEAVERFLQTTGKAAVIHPTGTGKSFIGFRLCEAHPESRVLWLSPSAYIFDTQIENLRRVTDGYAPENITFLTYAKQFFDKHGNLDAPAKSSIRKWLNQQRKSFQNGKLAPEQIEKLNAIGMVWETDDGWEQGFQEAERFYRAHSHLDIPAQYVTESGFSLGKWYRRQRNAVREGSITNERLYQLERIGYQKQSC